MAPGLVRKAPADFDAGREVRREARAAQSGETDATTFDVNRPHSPAAFVDLRLQASHDLR